MELPEKAITFYEKAMHLEPADIRWQILLGANLRRTGNLTQALQVYQKLYRDNPDNVQILQTLVRLAKDVGLKDTNKYEQVFIKQETTQKNITQLIFLPRLFFFVGFEASRAQPARVCR